MFHRRSLCLSVGVTLVAGLTVTTASAATAAPAAAATSTLSAAAVAAVANATSTDRLAAGERLVSGEQRVSPDGRYRFAMRADGSAALLDAAGTALWSTKAAGAGGYIQLRTDGKLVLFAKNNAGSWYAPPSAAGAELVVLNSGQIAVFVNQQAAWWSAPGPSAAGAGIVQTGTAPAYPVAPAPAPAPVTPQRDAAQHPFASTSPWNTPIGSGAKFESATGQRTASLQAGGKPVINRDQWSVAVFLAKQSDPTAKIVGVRNKVEFQAVVPTATKPTGGDDRHVTVVQPDGVTAYDVFKWETYTGGVATTQIVNKIDLRGSGINQGGRAARVPSVAGLIRAQELKDLKIDHALALAAPGTVLKSGYEWPATAQDYGGDTTYTGGAPMGTLFAIPGSVDVTKLGLSPEGLALARALQNYGTYLVDRAGTNALYCELDCNATQYDALRVAWRTLQPHVRAVTNNSATNVGGGGTPRVPLSPEIG